MKIIGPIVSDFPIKQRVQTLIMNNTLCVTFLAKKLNVLECFQFTL